MTLRILVTDGDQRPSLAVTRSLGRSGHVVHVAAPGRTSLAGRSRFAARTHRVPSPLEHPNEFIAAVDLVITSERINLLIPNSEAALLALLPIRDRWPSVVVPFPEIEVFRRVSDKSELLEVARRLGIAVPNSVTFTAATDDPERAVRELRFPLVLKPSQTVRAAGEHLAKGPVVHVRDAEEFRRIWQTLPVESFPLLAQERIVGPGTGVFLLRHDGVTRATFAHRRLREKPPSGGVSVYAESITADPALVTQAEALLACFEWQGVAMVEFKCDQATGTPYLMEVNGRFWGSLQLAIDAGVDFPKLLVDAVQGVAFAPPVYRPGARGRWFWGDIDHLVTRLRGSADSLHLPPGAPSLGTAAANILLPWRSPGRNEIWRWNDLGPAFYETGKWFRSLR
ncbi:MAG: ATP-grasp domain-containing protein [Gemmatimonadota bacterium]